MYPPPAAQGKRYSMPNARIMIHQPLGGASGAAVDIEIQVRRWVGTGCAASAFTPGVELLQLSVAAMLRVAGSWHAHVCQLDASQAAPLPMVCLLPCLPPYCAQAKEIMYHKANLNRIMSEYTGQPIEKVRQPPGHCPLACVAGCSSLPGSCRPCCAWHFHAEQLRVCSLMECYASPMHVHRMLPPVRFPTRCLLPHVPPPR